MNDRREFLRLALGGLGAASLGGFLSACDSRGPEQARGALELAESANEKLERVLMRHTSMDEAASARLAGRALPSYYVSRSVPVWDEAERGPWTLEVDGLVERPMRLTLDALKGLPSRTHRVNHYCVEGWTAVVEWTGVPMTALADAVGVMPGARYVDFRSFDSGYHESWDIESAMHPQTMIAWGWEGGELGPAHGAPARLHSPIKLGYKNVKYLTRIVFMNDRNGGYWSDKGYEWYGGT